ncbi:hypothetical protein [Pyrococcus kukulkanii]|uniref:hypothetical protein n=1 Tax=Pyrococcus kukulkanii TaxID=1609559 RepID=UPI003561DA12
MEFLNGASKRVGKRVALELKRIILNHRDDWSKAWEVFEMFEDHDGMDLVVCLSFAIMESLGVTPSPSTRASRLMDFGRPLDFQPGIFFLANIKHFS